MSESMTEPVVEMMQSGLAIMRVENDTLQAMAIQRPRDIVKLTNSAIAELRAFPKFAEKSYYSIPYKNNQTGETEMVEGPSIKAANALLRHWGNNSSGFRIVGSDDERITLQGVFVDHETGMRRTAEISVSRVARKRDGTYYPLAADRLNMAIQAGGSKAVRNAGLNALPFALVEGYFEEAKRIVGRGGDPEETPVTPADMQKARERLFKAFENLQVPKDEVLAYIARHPEIDTEEAVIAHLTGLLNGIIDGQVTTAEAFAVTSEKPIAEPQRATDSKTAPGSVQPGQDALKAMPAGFRRMDSKRESKCETCGKQITLGQKIGYDATKGRAHHANHFA